MKHLARPATKHGRRVAHRPDGRGGGGRHRDSSPHLFTRPRGDGDPVVKRQAKRVNVVVEEEDHVHGAAQPAQVLDAQVVVPEAGVAVQARGEELAGGVEEVDDGVGVGLSRGCPDYELCFVTSFLRKVSTKSGARGKV